MLFVSLSMMVGRKRNPREVVAYLLVILSIFSGISGKKTRFHLPWACSVLHGHYENASLIGACTIFEANKVLVSVDNFNDAVPGVPRLFYQRIVAGEIFVHSGSNYMNIELLKPRPTYSQHHKATKLYVVFKPDPVWEIVSNPQNISQPEVEHDVFGLSFNIGIMEIHGSFVWNPYVQPIPISGPDLIADTRHFSFVLRTEGIRTKKCVTYSWSHKLNKIRYHEVMYLAKENCLELYCMWKLTRCLDFPNKDYLKCFKATTFADVCPNARGAALYCPGFQNSVFAILTTAPSCGLRMMPGVYTTLDWIVEFYERVYGTKFDFASRPKYDLFSLPQSNDDYDGIDVDDAP